jgi:hypothetical protein
VALEGRGARAAEALAAAEAAEAAAGRRRAEVRGCYNMSFFSALCTENFSTHLGGCQAAAAEATSAAKAAAETRRLHRTEAEVEAVTRALNEVP